MTAAETTAELSSYDDQAAVDGGHAVCVVGYTKQGTFIVRNSWGDGWGDNGFAFASPGYLASACYPESYGVVI